MKSLCPLCGSKTAIRASVDSFDRIESKWRACERGGCNYDERRDGPPVDPRSLTSGVSRDGEMQNIQQPREKA
jgi:hypothetical protein